MSLVPTAGFRLLFRGEGTLTPGERVEGVVVLTVPEFIPRAEHLDLMFESVAWAGYGSGKSRSVVQRTMFNAPLHADIPAGGLAPGEYQYPFTLVVPHNLPIAYRGADCGVIHSCNLRLDVDWAIDPTATVSITIAPAPITAQRRPLAARSPASFHDAIALDVTMPSTAVVQGQRIDGTIALRTGHAADFDHITIALQHYARVTMGRRDVRTTVVGVVNIPATHLRSGQGVPFAFPSTSTMPPRSDNRSLDLGAELEITLHAGMFSFSNPRFSIALDVLPRGSTLTGDVAAQPVGTSRLATLAAFLGSRMNRPPATPPVLLQGASGHVSFWLMDGSRGSDYAAVHAYEFPDLQLGLRTRAAGLFTSESGITPPWMAADYALARARHPGTPTDDALRAFLARVLALPPDAHEINLSDHRLVFRRRLRSDGAQDWLDNATPVPGHALEIAKAIIDLPFLLPDETSRQAWTAVAREEDALLLAHTPALIGIKRGLRTLGGEERTFVASLVTHWDGETPSTWLDVALGAAWLTPQSLEALSSNPPHELLLAVRALFPDVHATTPDHLVAVRPGVASDPRTLLPALDALIEWVLLARGERRVDAPYR